MAGWTFISKHGQVLAAIGKHPDMTGRDISNAIGITERATCMIIDDLIQGGYLTKKRQGRRNSYTVYPEIPLKMMDASAGDLMRILGWKPAGRKVKLN